MDRGQTVWDLEATAMSIGKPSAGFTWARDDTILLHILLRRLWWLWAEWATGASAETG